jgi:shikimate kinase
MIPMNLILIGYRGTGKSTVARLLAAKLGWDWLDLDEEIERRSGQTIAAIFAQQGEEAFRDLESQLLAELAHRDRSIVALGGGGVLRPANRSAIRSAGTVVWLRATSETLWQRIGADTATAGRRPNLTAGGGLTEIVDILNSRTPIYRQCADWEVDTEGKTPAQVAAEIIEYFQSLSPPVAPQ